MARLLATWELGFGLGHVAKLAAIARALAVRGHECRLASRDVVTPAGLPDTPFGAVLQAPLWQQTRVTRPTMSYGQVIADGGFADDDGLIALVGAWLALFDLVKPAAIITEHAPASLLAAHVARLPAVRVGNPFTCPPARSPMPSTMPWLNPTLADRAAADAVADRVIRSVCRHYGAPVLRGVHGLMSGARRLLVSWPELTHDDADDHFHGPLQGVGLGVSPDWPDGPGPRLFVYLPFDRAAAAPLLAALSARSHPTLWISHLPPPANLPAQIRTETDPVDIRMALATADLVIGRGSPGLAMDAIAVGCPLLMLPDTLETECHSRALANRQICRILGADAGAIGAAIDALLAPDAPERAAARAAAARHAGHDPAAAAAAVVDALLAATGLA